MGLPEPRRNKRNSSTLFCYFGRPEQWHDVLLMLMGKKFKILEIENATTFGKMRVADVTNEADLRALHVEPVDWADETASGRIVLSGNT